MPCNCPPAETDITQLYACVKEAFALKKAGDTMGALDIGLHVLRGGLKFLPKQKEEHLVGAQPVAALESLTDDELMAAAETWIPGDGMVQGAFMSFVVMTAVRILVTRLFERMDGTREP